MFQGSKQRNAVLAVRVSTVGQGIDGDSPEAQIEQGKRYAPTHGINITKILTHKNIIFCILDTFKNFVFNGHHTLQ